MEVQARPSDQYDVFISFVASVDYKTARLIKNFLGSFHKRVEKSGLEIAEIAAFMDSDNLRRRSIGVGTAELDATLKQDLEKSEHLLVLCSSEAAKSAWVEREFDWYVAAKGDDKILLGVTDPVDLSSDQSAFPPYVKKRGLEKRLWYDFRSVRARRRDIVEPRPLEDVLMQLAAHLTGRSAEQVASAWYREQRRVARVRSYYIAGIATAAVIAIAGSSLAYISYLSSERSIADKFLQEGLKAEIEADNPSALSAYAKSLEHADTPIARYQVAGLLNSPVTPVKLFQLPVAGNQGRLSALAFVANADFVVGDKDGNLLLLNIDDGSTKRLAKFSSSVKAVAYFPHSNTVAVGLDDGEVTSVDLTSGVQKEIRKFEQPILGLQSDRDRDNLAIGVANNEGVFVLDKEATQLFGLAAHTDSVQALSFNHDGSYLYFGGSGPYLWACPIGGGGGCDRIIRADQYNYSISVSQNTRYSLATVGDQVLLFDHILTKMDVLLKSSGAHVYASAFDPTAQFAAVAASDGSVTVFDIPGKRIVLKTTVHNGESYALSFDGTGKRFTSVGLDGTVMVWRLDRHGTVMPSQTFQPKPWMLTPPQRNQIMDLRVLDEKLALVSLADMKSQLYDLPDLTSSAADVDASNLKAQFAKSFNRATATARFGQFDPAAAWTDESTQAKLDKLAIEIKVSALSPDGRFLAIVSEDGDTFILDASSEEIRTGKQKVPKATALTFLSSDPIAIAAANEDGDIIVMNGAELVQSSFKKLHARPIRALLNSRAGNEAIALGDDGFVGVIDLKKGSVARSIAVDGAQSVALSPNGSVLAVGTLTGKIEIVDLRTMSELATLSANAGGVSAVDFDPSGHYLYSGGFDEVLRRWEMDPILATATGLRDSVYAIVRNLEIPEAKSIALPPKAR
ncbi:hypothetical protein ELH21_10680 [Rhizobium leguminosarum]|uniref:TIR domain-containing protein n=1 Tax=Rhizobium leguminosarum TaxID=384 RepID=UPI001031B877|nr:TIR domain-containing protein [Rhizobium leguminosarum]TBD04819.1 hypothetical protein ELH21_10680 [Rhizobium leguminosarum]